MSLEKALEIVLSIKKEDAKKGKTILHKFRDVKNELISSDSGVKQTAAVRRVVNSCLSVISAFDEGIELSDIGKVRNQIKLELSNLIQENLLAGEIEKTKAANSFSGLTDLMTKNSHHLTKLPVRIDEKKSVALRLPIVPSLDNAIPNNILENSGIKSEYTGGLNHYSEGMGADNISGYYIFEDQLIFGVNIQAVKQEGYPDALEYARQSLPKLTKSVGSSLYLMDGSASHKKSKGWVYFWLLPESILDEIKRRKAHFKVNSWGLAF